MIYDITIIGAGPTGLSVAVEAKKNNLSHLIIEKGSIVNSLQNYPTSMTFFSTPELLEIGGVPFTSPTMRPGRIDGIQYYRKVSEFYNLNFEFNQNFIGFKKNKNIFEIETDKNIFKSKSIIIATGFFDNPNPVNVKGEELKKVSHYYSEPYGFFKQKVAIIGAKNSAAIAALELYRAGAEVTIIHRGKDLSENIKYWILPDLKNRIEEKVISVFFNTKVLEITEKEIELENLEKGKFKIENNYVFAMTGYRPDISIFENCGIKFDENSLAPLHNETFETNVEGVYVAGSITSGKNNNKIFIENGRHHGKIIIEDIRLKYLN
ncbi:MAG: YpdA family putative bacillithiol disulfide reductase [Bacteroidetes bacterium]|nr:YpdA family putative bacillithiol disulfide reductase [Bacteroidota bacterium]